MNIQHRTPRGNRGFTLIELMVSIAVILLLVTLVAVSLKTMGGSARRARSLSALKQIMLAYRSYSDDNRGQFMPGYIGADLMADGEPFGNLRVTLPDGTVLDQCDGEICEGSSYVWRLAPYVDNGWEAFYTDTSDTGLIADLEADYISGTYIRISERPSYGLNSIFVGGDSVHGGTDVTDRHPWTGDSEVVPIAATRITQVKNPARLIVFGASAKADPSGTTVYADESLGFCELRSPFQRLNNDIWIDPQWKVGARGLVGQTVFGIYNEPAGAGLPIVRNGTDVIPVGMLDGSTAAEQVSNLSRDMRRWSPFEVALRRSTTLP